MANLVWFAVLGTLAGLAARLLVCRLRRGAPVSPPWCELALAGVWAACGWCWSVGRLPGEWLPLLLGLSWLGVAAGVVDMMRWRLPDHLTLPALPVALILVAPLGPACLIRGCVSAAILFGAHLMVRTTMPAAMGAGDVKLAAPLGAALGAVSWPALVIWAVLAATITTAGALAAHGRAGAVPHGPGMLAAAWLVVAAGALGAAGATAWPA